MVRKQNPTVVGEIEYEKDNLSFVHSDINPPNYDPTLMKDKKSYRELLHACLDEWLDNSRGTGAFYIGDIRFLERKFRN